MKLQRGRPITFPTAASWPKLQPLGITCQAGSYYTSHFPVNVWSLSKVFPWIVGSGGGENPGTLIILNLVHQKSKRFELQENNNVWFGDRK